LIAITLIVLVMALGVGFAAGALWFRCSPAATSDFSQHDLQNADTPLIGTADRVRLTISASSTRW